MRDPDFTLTGGPTTVYPRVLAALGKPVTHHYDPSFLECFRRTEAKVGQVFGTGNEIILLQGEALLGLEAAARSLVRPGMPVLNLVSGIYGHGMGLWLKSFGAQVHELSVPYDEVADPEEVGVFLDAHPEIELLCVVHCETPFGHAPRLLPYRPDRAGPWGPDYGGLRVLIRWHASRPGYLAA